MDFNFNIKPKGPISMAFLDDGMNDFYQATQFVKFLPYKRNLDKNNPLAVIKEKIGTCSTKHALLKRLADENKIHELKLMQGIFKMNGTNVPAIKKVLDPTTLDYIPEAHNYFRLNNRLLDFTKPNFPLKDFDSFLLDEIEVEADQTNEFKINYFKSFLKKWLKQNNLTYSNEELWEIREACIRSLFSDK